MTRTLRPQSTPDALMCLLREQQLVRSADRASDGSWLVLRSTYGPKRALDGPLDIVDFALDVLLDHKLELEDQAA
ncbi:hypothetical protein [Streptacidiphilus sp. MAP5-52]|uniref:hypothetical protein n=1 Tax=Streptacidiphilus sp. MAP5-52 TaxID=3156267 RepID=UPI0035185ACC